MECSIIHNYAAAIMVRFNHTLNTSLLHPPVKVIGAINFFSIHPPIILTLSLEHQHIFFLLLELMHILGIEYIIPLSFAFENTIKQKQKCCLLQLLGNLIVEILERNFIHYH
jgi:hypothetical protein